MKKSVAVIIIGLMLISLCACSIEAVQVTEEPIEENFAGMPNPWCECTKKDIADEFNLFMNIPENASDVVIQKNETIKMGEAKYVSDGIEFIYRVQYTDKLEDISGNYCEWDKTENIRIFAVIDEFYEDYSGNEAIMMSGKGMNGDEQVICWYDPVFNRTLCLEASAKDLSSFDIKAVAEQMYYQPDPDMLNMD